MEDFLKIHPLDKIIEKIEINDFNIQDKKILGDDILDLLDKYGIASFGNGLIQTLDPVKSKNLLKGWKVPLISYPILKTSFGTIYFKTKNSIGYIYPIYKVVETDISDIEVLLDIFLCEDRILTNGCFKDIHDQVYQRLGLVDNDEIYAFVPALALSGGRNQENVEKVKMQEHLGFLSQL